MPFVTGQRLTADLLNLATPQMFYSECTADLVGPTSAVAVTGISIGFTTKNAGAILTTWWTQRVVHVNTGAPAVSVTSRPFATGPAGFSSGTSNFAVANWNVGAANTDILTTGNSNQMTLGSAGTYAIQLLATTGANEKVGLYSNITAMLQEVF